MTADLDIWLQAAKEQPDRQLLSMMLEQKNRGPCRAPVPFSLPDQPDVLKMRPCRRCLPCLKRKRMIALGRVMSEASMRPGSQVWTCTYDDEHLPEVVTAQFIENEKRSLLRRLQSTYGPGFKSWVVAQLGTQTQRFHFHAIIFPPEGVQLPESIWRSGKINADPHRIGKQAGLWSKGHRIVDEIHPKSVGYVLSYLTDTRKEKGTVANWKSNLIGEQYFRWFCVNHRELPVMLPGCYYLQEDQYSSPFWFPMGERERKIADELGYNYRSRLDDRHPDDLTPEQKNQQNANDYYQWLARNGPNERALSDERDRQEQAKMARVPEKIRLHPEVEALQLEIKANRKGTSRWRG